jgi:hypothetical protein
MKKTLALGLAAAGILAFSGTANAVHERGDLTVGLNGSTLSADRGTKRSVGFCSSIGEGHEQR